MSFERATRYLELPRAPETWIIEDLLPASGLCNVWGKPKAGKTYLALQMAVGISNEDQSEILGFPIRTHGPVCYLQIDTPRGLFATKYLEKIAGSHDISNMYIADSLMTPYPFNIIGEGGKWLHDSLAALPSPPVAIIVDTLRELHSGDENDSSVLRNVMTTLVSAVRSISPPPALILLSHGRKGDPKDPSGTDEDLMSGNRGSNYIAGRMDCIIQVATKKGKSHEGYLRLQSRTIEEQTLSIHRDEIGFWKREVDDDFTIIREVIFKYPNITSAHALAKILIDLTKRGSISTWQRRIAEMPKSSSPTGAGAN